MRQSLRQRGSFLTSERSHLASVQRGFIGRQCSTHPKGVLPGSSGSPCPWYISLSSCISCVGTENILCLENTAEEDFECYVHITRRFCTDVKKDLGKPWVSCQKSSSVRHWVRGTEGGIVIFAELPALTI